MEIMGRVSKGSRMDQVYLPKNRSGLVVGSYVVIKQVTEPRLEIKPYFYSLKYLEPIKLEIVKRIIGFIESYVENENIVITGSFLNKGFNFGDVDVLLITNESVNGLDIENRLYSDLGIKTHLIIIDSKSFVIGLESDPLFGMMLSRCVSKKRWIYHSKRKIDYKLLDLHLLKSKTLIDNFDVLKGDEKYYLTRNLIAIELFIGNKKIGMDVVDTEITKLFSLKSIDLIKNNLIGKGDFLDKYKKIYNDLFKKILKGVQNGAK